jgi:hypothetical protein
MYEILDHHPKMARKPSPDNPWRKRFLPIRVANSQPKTLQLEEVKELLAVSVKDLTETKLCLESKV